MDGLLSYSGVGRLWYGQESGPQQQQHFHYDSDTNLLKSRPDISQFSANLNGSVTSTGIVWSVQPSGTGNILQDGLYTAPAELNAPAVTTVQAELAGNNPVVSTAIVQCIPALPVITASSQDVIAPGPVSFQIAGSNFLPILRCSSMAIGDIRLYQRDLGNNLRSARWWDFSSVPCAAERQ